MGQLIFYNADNGKEGGRLSEIPDFLVHFRRCEEYDGGFGFDWLRDEYIYETKDLKQDIYDDKWEEITFPSICTKKEDLKKKYTELYEKQDKPYYIPWLSMFPNHETKTGVNVELQLKVEMVDTKWSKAKVKFECPTGIRIVPEEIELTKKDIIIQDAKGKSENKYSSSKVTVFCDKEHTGCEIIVKTVIDKKNPVETIVGKLNIMSTKEYPLNIRIVKLLRQEHLDIDREFINDRVDSIISYLKSKSLQQAMIAPQIESGDREIIFSEQEWKNESKLVPILVPSDKPEDKGKLVPLEDTENKGEVLYGLDKPMYIFREYKDKFEKHEEIQNCKEYEQYEEYKEVFNREKYEGYEIVRRTREYENGKKTIKVYESYKGIVVILSNIDYKIGGIAGMGNFHPSQENICWICKSGLTDKAFSSEKPQMYYPLVSHEIGHILGLDHTFENTLINWDSRRKYDDAKENLINYQNDLVPNEIKITEKKRLKENMIIEKRRRTNMNDTATADVCEHNIGVCSQEMKDLSESIIDCMEYIPKHQQTIESYEWFRDNLDENGCYFFEEGATDNIMDYYLMRKSNYDIFNTFYHWQWERMQKDLTKFHS